MMRTVGRNIGIQVGEPLMVQLHDDRTESYVIALKQQYHSQVLFLKNSLLFRYGLAAQIFMLFGK